MLMPLNLGNLMCLARVAVNKFMGKTFKIVILVGLSLLLFTSTAIPIAFSGLSKKTKTSSSSSGVISGEENQEICWNFLISIGYSEQGAAAVMGNWANESGFESHKCQYGTWTGDTGETHYWSPDDWYEEEYPEDLINNDQFGYGLAQWTYHSRAQGLVDFAKENNLSSGSIEAQLRWYEQESEGYAGVQEMKTSTDISSACLQFEMSYEGCIPGSSGARIQSAEEIYEKFKGTSADVSFSNSSSGSSSSSSSSSVKSSKKDVIDVGGGWQCSANPSSTTHGSGQFGDTITIAEELMNKGVTYVLGAAGPDHFDCSGYTAWCYREAYGIELPHFTDSQYAMCEEITEEEAQPGDLVFMNGSGSSWGHVGLYYGDGKCLHIYSTGNPPSIDEIHGTWLSQNGLAFGRVKTE